MFVIVVFVVRLFFILCDVILMMKWLWLFVLVILVFCFLMINNDVILVRVILEHVSWFLCFTIRIVCDFFLLWF